VSKLETAMIAHRYYMHKYASGAIRARKCPGCGKPALVTAKRSCGKHDIVAACFLCNFRKRLPDMEIVS
jgi:hypothetical protein